MARGGLARIAILGAGPIGLEAALYARKLGYPVEVYESGQVGEHVRRWGHVRLFSPFGMNVTPLGRAALRADNPRHEFPADGDLITGREHLACYLEPLAKSAALRGCLHTQTQVLHVARQGFLKGEAISEARRARQPFRLLLQDDKRQERIAEADVVLDCTGTYGRHRWLGDGGIPALGELAAQQHIAYTLEDVLGERRHHYAGKYVLVVGGGYSAATTVANLAALAEQHPETWVIWAARCASSQPIGRFANDPLKERDRLAARANLLATRDDANVEFHPQTVIDAIQGDNQQGFRVTARVAGQERTWQVDRVIANVGYTPNNDLYRELQVHECYASLGPMKLAAALLGTAGGDCLKQTALGADTLRNPEPNFFILGAKSYGRNSHFLLRVGFEQVREVFQLISGQKNLDLYKG